MHEEFTRNEEVATSSDRSFGLTIGAVCGVIGGIRLYFGHSYALWILGIGAILAAVALCWPAALAPLNRWWARLGRLLNKIVNPIVMTLLYCLTIVPFGLAMQLRGKDPLRLKRDPQASSYWIVREPPGPAPDTMRNQF